MIIGQQTFFQKATVNWRHISRWTALFGLTVSAFGASTDLVAWWQGVEAGPFRWFEAGIQLLLTLGAIYLAASDILNSRVTWLGSLRFIATAVLLFLPFAATFGILILIKPLISEGWRLIILFGGVLFGMAVIALLPAWPLAQAVQTTLVSPLMILRSTRGHRGGLILISFALGAINKADFIPAMRTANNFGEAALIAAGQSLMGFVSIAFTASIAATALQFGARQDGRMGGYLI